MTSPYRSQPVRTRPRVDEPAPGTGTPQIFGGDAPESVATAETWDHERIQSVIRAELDDARNYLDQEIAPDRARALEFYNAEPFGNEVEGRSQFVMTPLRDTILGILPSLVRMYLGSERTVEFEPKGKGDEAGARQRMDYLNLVVRRDNPGFNHFYTLFKEGLLQDYAIVKWWWDDRTVVTAETYEGQTQEQVAALAEPLTDQDDISYEEDGQVAIPEDALQADPTTPTPGKVPTYKVRIVRRSKKGKATFAPVPAEEFLVSRGGRTLDEKTLVSHVRPVTRSDLLAMGYTAAFIDEHEGVSFAFGMNDEWLARYPEILGRQDPGFNPDLAPTLYGEHYIRFIEENEEVATLHKVCTLGDDCFVAKVEEVPEIPFAILCADPEPHKCFGNGFYRLIKDLQLVQSAIMRAILDSLRASVDPRTVVNEDRVNLDDVMNQEIASIIRTSGIPQQDVVPLTVPFAGDPGLRVLDYFDGILEKRSGQTKGSQGLNADQLQSTAELGIAAQMSAAQQRIEMVARIFGENGIKQLLEGLQRLVMRHQDVERVVKLRDEWVPVNPRTWDEPLDVTINVGLGNGTPDERIRRLTAIKETMEGVIQQIGPSQFVDFTRYRNILAKIAELSGEVDPTLYFGEVPPGWAPPAPPQKPDPAMLLAQAQAQEIQAKLQIAHDKAAADRLEMLLKAETDRMKIEADIQIALIKEQIAAGHTVTQQQIDAALEHMRIRTDAVLKAHETETDHSARVDEANLAAQAQVEAAKAAPPGGA